MVAGAMERGREEGREPASLRRWMRAAVAAQQGRAFLWSPVVLTFGIWTYFGLAAEPSLTGTTIAAAVALMLMWLGRRLPLVLLAGLVVIGFSLAKFRAEMVATPLLHATTAEVLVTGTVRDVQHSSARRLTLIVAPDAVEGLTADRTPRRLRLSTSLKLGEPSIGTRVSLKARLSPLPSPVQPGGFDYGRKLWFEGIGGTGRVTAPITTLAETAPLSARLDSRLETVRTAMGRRIRATLDEPIASFAEALITGERSTIPRDLNQSLLVSGLFHILSISGLHMWLVAGGIFWSVRAALALVPRLALNHPIKKWAAVAALAMGWFYMLLADSGVATERSFIMIAVVFFAVLVDRPALSTRNLAIAAIIVLVGAPEAAVEASFQMSFLAVLGLVAFYEAWSKRSSARDAEAPLTHNWLARGARKVALGTFLSIATTLIAGSMSSIPAAYHFGRLAPYAVIANGLTLPVIGILVMPPALLAAVLMPVGLDPLPLWVMGKGLQLVLLISDWVATFPGAYVVVAQPPAPAMTLLAGGAALLCLLAGQLRLLGVAVIAAGLALTIAAPPGPDVFVERIGSNVAIRDGAGELVPARARKSRFAVDKWLQTNGEETKASDAAKRRGWTCTPNRCDATVKNKRLTYVFGGEGKPLDCAGIDILIAAFPLRRACTAVPLRIDRFDLWRHGAHAIRISTTGASVETARGAQGKRPWVVVPEPRKTPFKPRTNLAK